MLQIIEAQKNLSNIILKTPLQLNTRLSEIYSSRIYIKREDLQVCRSFKIRGALNKIIKLKQSTQYLDNGIVCASAGNHAQGVAYSSRHLNINADIFVPNSTPIQKIKRIRYFSDPKICNIHITGNSFDECLETAREFTDNKRKDFIHPFNDLDVIYGQATVGLEIYDKINPDMIISGIGGGGLISGVSLYSKYFKPECSVIGVEPDTCPSMKKSIESGELVNLTPSNNFVDGATVSQVGEETFNICRENLDDIYEVSVGNICQQMLKLYEEDGIISEPAGALPFTILDELTEQDMLKNKKIICILSGGNNDLTRYPDILDRAQQYLGIRHYYILQFIQRPGQLKDFVNTILGPDDDIIRFEYIKKTEKGYGSVLVGVDLQDSKSFTQNLENSGYNFVKLRENNLLYDYLV